MGLYSQYIQACGLYIRKDSYKTIHRLPKNLRGISLEEFGKMVNLKLLLATFKHSYALLTPKEIRAIYYAFLLPLLHNTNGKFDKTGLAIKNEINKFFTYEYSYNNLPKNLRNLIDYFEVHGYFDELRANTLNKRIKIAYNLASAYLEAHRGLLDDFIALNNSLGRDVGRVFSKKAAWAIAIPSAHEIEKLLKYLEYNKLLRVYAYNGDYENLVKYINPFPSTIIDDFSRYIANATTSKEGVANLFKDIFVNLGADFLSTYTTILLQSGIIRTFYHLARAGYLAYKGVKFLTSLLTGFVGFVGFTAFEWLVLERMYSIILSHVFEAFVPLAKKKFKPAEIRALYDYLDKIYKGYELNDAERAHFDYLKSKYGDKVVFALLNKVEIINYVKQIENLKHYFDDKLVEKFEDYLNGDAEKEDLDGLVDKITQLEKVKRILTKNNVNVRSCSKASFKEEYSGSSYYTYDRDYYRRVVYNSAYKSGTYNFNITGGNDNEFLGGTALKGEYKNTIREYEKIDVDLNNSLISVDLFFPILNSLKNGSFDPSTFTAYLHNDIIVFSYYDKVRSILKPIIRNKCISLSYLRKNKVFKIPVSLGTVEIKYSLSHYNYVYFLSKRYAGSTKGYEYKYKNSKDKDIGFRVVLEFTTDTNNNPVVNLLYELIRYTISNYTYEHSLVAYYPPDEHGHGGLFPLPYCGIFGYGYTISKNKKEYRNEIDISSYEQLYTISSVSAPPVPFKKPKFICVLI